MSPVPSACAVLLTAWTLPDGGGRGVVRVGADRVTLADLDGGSALPLFQPTTLERLATFAEQAACGHPAAVTHPKAHLFLSALALAALALLDAGPAGAVAGERTHDDEDDNEEGDG